ncbi:aldose epimerase family protein [Aquimarina sp. Aq107]|uniref:aldose epimerase family protein n=1 Tax=Aquimarina sp. Aq107 TaxID=1191912 RepID=UPI000D55BE11|nr:aldose epimerase family protein [Aquimarina sp. Aq107]
MTQKTWDAAKDTTFAAITLQNTNGGKLKLTNYGASIVSLEIPNKENKLVNVVLGLETVNEYKEVSYHPSAKFLGASIGRYAGRISNGGFELDGNKYEIHQNNGVHLHGGYEGFDKKIWRVDSINHDTNTAIFSYNSRHLEEGYPGNLKVKAIYHLSEDNDLTITYKAVSDIDTVVNLTNHAYFNLNGSGDILDHTLLLDCPEYLEVDTKQLPTGKTKSVTGTKFDFLTSTSLRRLINSGHIDDTFIFNMNKSSHNRISLESSVSGLKMEVKTNQPAVVIFTPENFPDWNFKDQVKYDRFPAICFETQNYPDAPNHKHFPSSLLKAGKHYENKSVFKFSVV